MKVEYYAIDDGCGIVGYGFECPFCQKDNMFVDEEESEHECELCKQVVEINPITYEA